MDKKDLENIQEITNKCHIYYNHIRCETNQNIYTSSITHDDGTLYLKPSIENNINHTWEQKAQIYKKISKEMKCNKFANLNYIHGKNRILQAIINIKKIIHINETVFFFPYPPHWPFAHYINYGYQYFYYYMYLKNIYPNIKIIMNKSDNNKYWLFLKKTLNLKDIIFIDTNTCIINIGTTFCIYSQMESPVTFSNKCIEFYNTIGNLSLSKNKIDINLKNYPKKLLFLRKSSNIASNSKRLLENRQQIVDLCKKYNYIDIDQTNYTMEEVIYLMNNATHLITEVGGSIVHLLWTSKPIKHISINWSYEPWQLLPNFYENSNKYLKLMPPCSGSGFENILKNKETTVIYNTGNQKLFDLLEGKYNSFSHTEIPQNRNFKNIEELENAIKANE